MKNKAGSILLNLIYPPRCVFCGKRLPPKTARIHVCSDCANSLPYCRAYNRCRRCGKPIPDGKGEICKTCYTRRHYNVRVTSPFLYADEARNAVIAFKKEQNSGYARTFAVYIAEMVKHDFGGEEIDVVVSVPPRRKEFYSEHFDQAACLASASARRLGLPFASGVMVQTGKLKKQSSLTYDERIANVSGKFAVKKPNAVKNKTVLIVDDVCTTGATIEECARVLREAGAYRVYAATLATVPY